MAKKQQKEKEILEKMSDGQKDEVLKEKKRKETERKALYIFKASTKTCVVNISVAKECMCL